MDLTNLLSGTPCSNEPEYMAIWQDLSIVKKYEEHLMSTLETLLSCHIKLKSRKIENEKIKEFDI